MLVAQEEILGKLSHHLDTIGIHSEIETRKLDFESDYKPSYFYETSPGIGSAGTLAIRDKAVSYINMVKKLAIEECHFTRGSYVGMGKHMHTWWKTRYFVTFDMPLELGPLKFGTLAKVSKGRFRSKVDDFIWSGYGKLTTLPPGHLYDDVIAMLESDVIIREMVLRNLLKENTISISAYRPKPDSKAMPSGAAIMISSEWKTQNELFAGKDLYYMYMRIASVLQDAVTKLEYHLKK